MIKGYYTILIGCTLLSCNSQNDINSGINQKLDSILKENKKLNDKIESLENQNINTSQNPIDRTSTKPIDISSSKSKGVSPKTQKKKAEPIDLTMVSYYDLYPNEPIKDPFLSYGKRYAFVLLRIVKKEFDTEKGSHSNVNYYYVSDIKTFNNFTEDARFRFLDEVLLDFKNSYMSNNLQSITDRTCYFFETYSEASRFRAKYITDEN